MAKLPHSSHEQFTNKFVWTGGGISIQPLFIHVCFLQFVSAFLSIFLRCYFGCDTFIAKSGWLASFAGPPIAAGEISSLFDLRLTVWWFCCRQVVCRSCCSRLLMNMDGQHSKVFQTT
eukprot:GHVS01022069.1.p1 GENE.GHVS01022069.1~~GHVS01022069.1.p1  ORF type:complete len:118 (-),score=14.75 GHVS01022069.1:94-447(-)